MTQPALGACEETPARRFGQVGYGPLAMPSQSPMQALRLGLRPRTPSTLRKGKQEVSVSNTWANTWVVDNAEDQAASMFFLDYETNHSRASLAHGLTSRLQIEGSVEVRSRFGGGMDNLIQQFHDLAGFDQSGRDQVPTNQFRFNMKGRDGSDLVSLGPSDRGIFSRTLELNLQHTVSCGSENRPAFSYALTARMETEDSGLGLGNALDFGASAAFSRRVKNTYFYGMLGYAVFGENEFQDLSLENTQITIVGAFEWAYLPRHALIVQYLLAQEQLDDYSEFSRPSSEIGLGWKWEMSTHSILEFGILENVFTHDNSSDFGIHLGFAHRF